VTDLIKIADLLEIPVTTFFETAGGRVISLRVQPPAPGSAAAA
jgi:hypothetical protein